MEDLDDDMPWDYSPSLHQETVRKATLQTSTSAFSCRHELSVHSRIPVRYHEVHAYMQVNS